MKCQLAAATAEGCNQACIKAKLLINAAAFKKKTPEVVMAMLGARFDLFLQGHPAYRETAHPGNQEPPDIFD